MELYDRLKKHRPDNVFDKRPSVDRLPEKRTFGQQWYDYSVGWKENGDTFVLRHSYSHDLILETERGWKAYIYSIPRGSKEWYKIVTDDGLAEWVEHARSVAMSDKMKAYKERLAKQKAETRRKKELARVARAKYLGIKYRKNYSDEFDLTGFLVMTQDEWRKFNKEADEFNWPQECYFGTNEAVWYDSADDYIRSFTPSPISKAAYDGFKKAVGGERVGMIEFAENENVHDYS